MSRTRRAPQGLWRLGFEAVVALLLTLVGMFAYQRLVREDAPNVVRPEKISERSIVRMVGSESALPFGAAVETEIGVFGWPYDSSTNAAKPLSTEYQFDLAELYKEEKLALDRLRRERTRESLQNYLVNRMHGYSGPEELAGFIEEFKGVPGLFEELGSRIIMDNNPDLYFRYEKEVVAAVISSKDDARRFYFLEHDNELYKNAGRPFPNELKEYFLETGTNLSVLSDEELVSGFKKYPSRPLLFELEMRGIMPSYPEGTQKFIESLVYGKLENSYVLPGVSTAIFLEGSQLDTQTLVSMAPFVKGLGNSYAEFLLWKAIWFRDQYLAESPAVMGAQDMYSLALIKEWRQTGRCPAEVKEALEFENTISSLC